jgi:ribonuclease P protein component
VAGSHAFPRHARLRRRREFLAVQHNGRRSHTAHFVIIRRAGTGPSRLGVTVSARVGNAVARNRVKRLVREIFRNRRAELRSAADIVVIAKTGADDLTYAQAATELEPALEFVPSR